jgi:hypothetical protein
MPFEKVEFQFPDPDKPPKDGVEVEISSAENVLDVNPKPQKVEPTPTPAPKEEVKAESDIEIEVVDDTPPKDRNRKPSAPPEDPTEDELNSYSDNVKKRIQHFTKGYHDERRKAEAAQREREEALKLAQKLMEENNQLKQSVNKNQEALLEQAKARVAVELEQAKKKYKEAYESGDSDQLVEAQEALTAAKIRADRVQNYKLPPLQKTETVVQPQPSTQVPDPKAADWQSKNQWFGSDEEMTSLALGLHQKLVREGIDPRSDDYYDRIDRRMRQVFPDRFEDESVSTEDEPPAPKPSKKAANVVAPATRSTAPKKIVLTQTQVTLAKRLGVPLELYAQKVAEQMRNQNG